MRATTLLKTVLGIKFTHVTGVAFSPDGIICDVAPSTSVPRCGSCWCRVDDIYDHRERLWRHLDLGGMKMELRYEIRRVECPRCGVTTELVPWARHCSSFTDAFEQTTAFLAQTCAQTVVAEMMRVAWRTVGAIIRRVVERLAPVDRLAGLTHIGIDELSYRKHHEYVTIVVDHMTGKVVWAHPGKNAETLGKFFTALGKERCALLKAVTIDMSAAYRAAAEEHAINADIIFDRFHVQKLAHDALDEVRRAEVRAIVEPEERRALKHTRFALHKNPWNLTAIEEGKLVDVQRTNYTLYRAYLLKESLAAILDRHQPNVARKKLGEWISWATHSGIAPFAKVGRTIGRHLDGIVAYIASGLSNGRSEGLNGKARTITRRSYGFHDSSSLIAMLFLCCSGIILSPARTLPCTH
jgi:transposase